MCAHKDRNCGVKAVKMRQRIHKNEQKENKQTNKLPTLKNHFGCCYFLLLMRYVQHHHNNVYIAIFVLYSDECANTTTIFLRFKITNARKLIRRRNCEQKLGTEKKTTKSQ